MAFPVVESTATSFEGADVTSHDVTMPSGISSGDLILVIWSHDGSSSENFTLTSTPGPLTWTRLWTDELESSGHNGGVRVRVADGTEGATQTFTTDGAQTSAHIALRISGEDGSPDATRVESSSSETTPDPPSHTSKNDPTAEDILWIATCHNDNEHQTTAYPTNYDDNQLSVRSGADSSGECHVSIATRNLNGTSDDPGTFTIDSAEDWSCGTIAVYPSGAAPSTAVKDIVQHGVLPYKR